MPAAFRCSRPEMDRRCIDGRPPPYPPHGPGSRSCAATCHRQCAGAGLWRCAARTKRQDPGRGRPVALSQIRAPPRRSPKPQVLRDPARCLAAQRISAFSTALTARPEAAKLGGCANGLRIACGASPLGGRRHHSLVTPIDWKLHLLHDFYRHSRQVGHHSLVTPIDWKRWISSNGMLLV